VELLIFAPDGDESLIALLMEAASTSETSVVFYQSTRRNIPEESSILAAVRA
jgi:hypothetical protein